jgi:hypothetical protein
MPRKSRVEWVRSASREDRGATFERQKAIMEMYSDNARTYIQLSGAALVLTLTFADRILRIPSTAKIATPWMIAVWACFLLTIIAGAFYQYLAVKTLDAWLEWDYVTWWNWLSPGIIYAVMLLAFYGGAVAFTGYAIVKLGSG